MSIVKPIKEYVDMPLLVTKDARSLQLHVYDATEEQITSFNEADYLDVNIMGWKVESAEQLAETSLSVKDILALHNEADPTRRIEGLGKFTKRTASNATFDVLATLAEPYDMTPAAGESHPAKSRWKQPEAAPKQATVKQTMTRIRDGAKQPWHERAAKPRVYSCRPDSAHSRLVDALWKGATFEDLRAAVPKWTDSSIKSGLSYDINTLKGYGFTATGEGDDMVLNLVLPEGMDKPLEHTRQTATWPPTSE